MLDGRLDRAGSLKNDSDCLTDESMFDEANLYLRDLLVTRVRIAHRGRRRTELVHLDRLIDQVMMDVHEMNVILFEDVRTNGVRS